MWCFFFGKVIVFKILALTLKNKIMKLLLSLAFTLLISNIIYAQRGFGRGSSTGSTGSTGTFGTQNTNTTQDPIKDALGGVIGSVTGNGSGTANFTQTEAANAIKEALIKGINIGVQKVSVKDGYLGNNFIQIPFPKDAQLIASNLQRLGAGDLVNKLVIQMNRSAEQAAKDATPIFLNSIKQMTINDAINIVSNQQPDAATRYLQRNTTDQLVLAFRPKIKSALDQTQTTKLWSTMMTTYNRAPFVQKINPDLTDFVTRKALDGLFFMVAQEEAKIRKDPLARTTDILTKVFGNIKL
jgi:hypothetical protein